MPFKGFNPPIAKLFGSYLADIHSETIRSITIDHLVKLRHGEFCPLVKRDAFLCHFSVEGDKSTERCVRSVHFRSDEDKAATVAYRRKNGLPDVMPGDEDWLAAYSPIFASSYAENVRRINEYRQKK